jgi:hypothetical protein
MLFVIFAIYPDPGGPQLKMFLPIPPKTIEAFSKSSFEELPTMNVKVPFAAPITPPLIGVSQKIMPFFLASAVNSFTAIGEIVEVSTMQVPSLALSKIPFY